MASAMELGPGASRDCCSMPRWSWTTAAARRLFPTSPGWLAWIARIGPARPNDGSCVRCKRSSMPGCIPTAGTRPKPSSTMRGRRLWSCIAAPIMPPSCSNYPGNDSMDWADPSQCALLKRQIPALKETLVPAQRLAESGRMDWLRDPADWFEFRMPNSYRVVREEVAEQTRRAAGSLPATATDRQGVLGHIRVPRATGGLALLYHRRPGGNHCGGLDAGIARAGRSGLARYAFLRLDAIRLPRGRQPLREFRLRVAPLAATARPQRESAGHDPRRGRSASPVRLAQRASHPLFRAGPATAVRRGRQHAAQLRQETCVDGMGRERQQYSGDCGHQLHAIRYAFGETRLPARFLRTFSEGMTPQGYFLDCWPAYDRLARLMQKQMTGLTGGRCWTTASASTSTAGTTGCRPATWRRSASPIRGCCDLPPIWRRSAMQDGLLPVENLGVPTVWIDHDAYRQQRHKQCAFNLYAAAMLQHALAPIARAFGDEPRAREANKLGGEILQATVRRFWSAERGLFVNNLPWLPEEKTPRLCDRSLATSILFDQCPNGQHRRGGSRTGRMSRRDGPVLSVQRQLALLGLG